MLKQIFLGGNLKGGVNREGINYYNNLINELISNGQQKSTLSLCPSLMIPESNITKLFVLHTLQDNSPLLPYFTPISLKLLKMNMVVF